MEVMPVAIPVISTLEGFPGVVIGTGFSSHGFGISPGAGEVLADLATRASRTSLTLSRFFDRTRALPGSRF